MLRCLRYGPLDLTAAKTVGGGRRLGRDLDCDGSRLTITLTAAVDTGCPMYMAPRRPCGRRFVVDTRQRCTCGPVGANGVTSGSGEDR